MLYRTTAVFIVLFWLTMTALLVHQEVRPSDSALREIPVSHVVKLLLMHHEKSSLSIASDEHRLGHLELMPHVDEATGSRQIAFSGWLQLAAQPGTKKRDRVAWHGDLEMDKLLNTQLFRVSVAHPADGLVSEITVVPAENVAHYKLLSSNGMIEREDYSLDERGLHAVMQELGFQDLGLNPMLISFMAQQHKSAPLTVKARLSTLPVLKGENMDTFLITVDVNEQNLLSCHVDQLGHVVYVSTLLGFTLSAEM